MKKWRIEEKDSYSLVINEGGATLSFDPNSGITLLEDDGFAFKDLNRNGVIDPYEDWRLPIKERTDDLVARMETDECLAMMMHAGMFIVQKVTEETLRWNAALRARLSVSGKSIEEFTKNRDITQVGEEQMCYVDEGLRFWLISTMEDPGTGTKYMNNVQRHMEKTRLGIPAFFSTNPRAFTDTHSDIGEKDVSSWPTNLGLGATFDPAIATQMAETVAKEYRALGITVELGPQVDVATDPRWNRFSATYGSDPILNTDMARAVCDGFQTSSGEAEIEGGWGKDSVMAMTKHWPGSTGEGGRESHSKNGRFSIYPGGNLKARMTPWTEGAFKLSGPTGQCSSIMSCYDVLYQVGGDKAENVGASFLRYAIDGMLREENDFKGFACTDFWITGGPRLGRPNVNAWGLIENTPAERALKQMEAGIDQLGGLGELSILQDAYKLAVEKHGEHWAQNRIRTAVSRILPFCFGVGSFEDPYRDPAVSDAVVGNAQHRAMGMDAHRKSVVLLKNSDVLPAKGKKVYIADKFSGGIPDRGGNVDPITSKPAFSAAIAGEFFTVVPTPEEADIAIVLMDSPNSGSGTKGKSGEVIPISLQYRDYTAVNARYVSVAGDIVDGKKENMSYRGKTVSTYNSYDLDQLEKTRAAMGTKPVVAVLRCTNPIVPHELEPLADAVMVIFGNTPEKVVMEAIAGAFEPSGLLPFQMPASMDAVEVHLEDTPRDIEPYTDAAGHAWDFAYGMNWSGVISDGRVEKYR